MITNAILKRQSRAFATGLSQLKSISPLDGRYARQVNDLRPYFSEFALMKYRVYVELEWYKLLFREKIVTKEDKTVSFVRS